MGHNLAPNKMVNHCKQLAKQNGKQTYLEVWMLCAIMWSDLGVCREYISELMDQMIRIMFLGWRQLEMVIYLFIRKNNWAVSKGTMNCQLCVDFASDNRLTDLTYTVYAMLWVLKLNRSFKVSNYTVIKS